MAVVQAAVQAAIVIVVVTVATAAAGIGGVFVTVSVGIFFFVFFKSSILKENMTLYWLISGFIKFKVIVCCKGSRRSIRFVLSLFIFMQTC